MKGKVIQDSKDQMGWQSYILIDLGILIGIIIVSLIKHQEMDWISIGRAIGVAVLLFIFYFLLREGIRRVEQNR